MATASISLTNGINGTMTWPDQYIPPLTRWTSADEAMLQAVVTGLLARPDSILMSHEDLAERAVEITRAVLKAARNTGINL